MQGSVFVPHEALETTEEFYPVIYDETRRLYLSLEELERQVQMARSDPKRRDTNGVWVPVTWLVGQRVGY